MTGADAEGRAPPSSRTSSRPEKEGLPKRFLYSFVTARSSATPDRGPSWLKEAGYATDTLGFGHEDRAEVRKFVPAHLGDLSRAAGSSR